MVRTRIVCVSDTHNYTPGEAGFKLPKGDVLIHAGDITNRGTEAEFRKSAEWIRKADFEVKIVIAGNHDVTLDSELYAAHGADYHKEGIQSSEECLNLISSPPIIYLNHESKTIRLKNADGPRTMFKAFGSPRIPVSSTSGIWHMPFSYPREDVETARQIWGQIPLDTDIVVTHTPPLNHLDYTEENGLVGCEYFRQALWRVRPRLAVCGHVHESRGFVRVRWDASARAEDLGEEPGVSGELASGTAKLPPRGSKKQSLVDLMGRKMLRLDNDGSWENIGQHRKGRNETCIVNASIRATNFPHVGGRKFNAPIVVDIDLPLDDE